MTKPPREPDDRTVIEPLARARHDEMQRAAERGERNIRHGARGRSTSPWEFALAWLAILACVAGVAWLLIASDVFG